MGSLESILFILVLVGGPVLFICWAVLTIIDIIKHSKIKNFSEINNEFRLLRDRIRYASTLPEVSKLHSEADEFYTDFNTLESHAVVNEFFNSLQCEITFKQAELIGAKKKYSALRISAIAIILLAIVFS